MFRGLTEITYPQKLPGPPKDVASMKPYCVGELRTQVKAVFKSQSHVFTCTTNNFSQKWIESIHRANPTPKWFTLKAEIYVASLWLKSAMTAFSAVWDSTGWASIWICTVTTIYVSIHSMYHTDQRRAINWRDIDEQKVSCSGIALW